MNELQRAAINEHLLIERSAEYKSEKFGSKVQQMSDVPVTHHDIKTNLMCLLRSPCKGTDYQVLTQMRVLCPNGDVYYPDLLIMRRDDGQYFDTERDTLLNPVAVIEIATIETHNTDRVIKRDGYSRVPSLELYILIDLYGRATTFQRIPEQIPWRIRNVRPGGQFEFPCLPASIPHEAVFDEVTPFNLETWLGRNNLV